MSESREILGAAEFERPLVGEELFQLVYDELRQLAAARLAHECAGQTLQPTALVHEVYLRLTAGRNAPEWGEQMPLLRGRDRSHATHSYRPSAA